ncbi:MULTISPECIES: RNA polymerase sigma factor [Nocardiaceae]|uniref:RNA polymerase sigma factor n=1 Tax=Nocardiaceae TaxID=85025 RepID=UPI000561C32A|nr:MULTISPECIES: sigma-70 family RNA polymerase sigma factor [Rhodococcus]OZF07208.1 RNA polymerase subunit sigma-24 [Rhodococcus sp. 15-1189-1-1a]OZF22732.1 RNA polymerase subunit sigma-24 [Rhodococcus sp. 14-2686-1-2]
MSDDVRTSLSDVFREEHGRLLASMVHRYGDIDLAEEVTSEAIEVALQRWPIDGVPTKPGAWLLTTARRRAVDRLRRDRTLTTKLAILQIEQDRASSGQTTDALAVGTFDDDVPDERLQMFFMCAHPALNVDDRLAITLRCLAQLTTAEVARAFMIPPSTAGQRISRAKKKIREARVPFRIPGPDELPTRLTVVLQVVYSIFTEGYAASSGDDLVRVDLADEAIRLARILQALLPREREVTGLLALMLSVHARSAARVNGEGTLVMLDQQDRARWDRDMIGEGADLTVQALTGGAAGPYSVQAAIAALHVESETWEATDWAQIVELYGVLMSLAPSPVVAVNRAAAIALRDGPAAGLMELDALADEPALQAYSPYHAARGDVLSRLGASSDAAICFERARTVAGSIPERDYLRRRADDARDAAGA